MHVLNKSGIVKRYAMSILFLLLFASTGWAQTIKVSGVVKDNKGETQIGVSVLVKGTRTGVATGLDGSYTINAPETGSLVFSAIGMKTKEVPINKRSTLNVTLEVDALLIDEIIVVGYGTQKKENLTGAVSTVDVTKTMESRPITDVGRALQGSTPGLTVTTSDGSIGGSPNIKIRGMVSTISGGNGNPLILVDNVEVPNLSYVNSDDIESISVLKDAATTAIYGARAAFGAILITTKKGSREGKVKVSYSNNFAFSTPTKFPDHTRADLGLQYSWDQQNAFKQDNPTWEFGYVGFYYNPDVIQKVSQWIDQYGDGSSLGREMVEGRDFEYRTSGGTYYYRPWDIKDIYFKTWTPQQNQNITITGGNEKVQYNLSAGYVKQTGILKLFEDFYQRKNLSGSISTDVNKWLTVRTNYMYAKTVEETPFVYAGAAYEPVYYLYRWHQTYPYGTYNGNEFRGGVNDLKQAKPEEWDTYYSRYSAGTTLNIAKGLTADFDYTYTQTFSTLHRVGGYVTGIDHWSRTGAMKFDNLNKVYTTASYDYAQYTSSKNIRNTYNAYATYDKKFNDVHSFKAMVGTNIEDAEYIYLSAKRNGVYDFDKGEVNLAGGDQTATSEHSWWSISGFFSRLNYSYKDKYLVEVNGRYDGSSKFGSGKRWGFFPSASAAWRVTEEPWMQPIKMVLNSLKIRGSYGEVGNQDVPLNAYIPTMGISNPSSAGNYWLIGNNFTPYISSSPALVDQNLSWETVSTLDLGLDARLFRDKMGITFDWFERKTKDMLSPGETLPSTVGASAPRQNFGELSTKGVEIAINFNHTFSSGVHLSLSGQFTDFKTIVTKYPSAADPSNSATYYQGKVLGEIWGYKTDGLYQVDDFVWENGIIKQTLLPNGQSKNTLVEGVANQYILESGLFKYGPGDVKFKDINNDGVIDYGTNTVGSSGDRTVIGNTTPRYQYGFRVGADWKGIDIDLFFQGVGKRSIWATGNMVLPGFYGAEANYSHTMDYWTPENTQAFYPRPVEHAQAVKWNYVPNDRYLLNAAYLRLKTLNIGYSLPKSLLSKVKIEKLRVYFSAENLFELDKMGDIPIDPELDWTTNTSKDGRSFGRSYPYRRTLSFGVQLQF